MRTILLLTLSILMVSCKTQEVEIREAFTKKSPVSLANPNLNTFLVNVSGEFKTISDTPQTFTVDGKGSFQIDKTVFTIHKVINENSAIYIAATPIEDGKILYTYHGLKHLNDRLVNVPYKKPTYKDHREVLPQESKYYWEINTFRIENIDWGSGLTTPFAEKISQTN